MSDKILRSKLIRLAHAKPELRDILLPLLVTASEDGGKQAKQTQEVKEKKDTSKATGKADKQRDPYAKALAQGQFQPKVTSPDKRHKDPKHKGKGWDKEAREVLKDRTEVEMRLKEAQKVLHALPDAKAEALFKQARALVGLADKKMDADEFLTSAEAALFKRLHQEVLAALKVVSKIPLPAEGSYGPTLKSLKMLPHLDLDVEDPRDAVGTADAVAAGAWAVRAKVQEARRMSIAYSSWLTSQAKQQGPHSESAIRSEVIRLAHANPHLRADLLPLLSK